MGRYDDPKIVAAVEAIERVILEHADTLAPHTDVDGDWISDTDGEAMGDAALSGFVLVCDWTSLAEGERRGAIVVEQPSHVSRATSIGLLQLGLDARRGVGD